MDGRLLTALLAALGALGTARAACPVGMMPPCDCVDVVHNVTWPEITGVWYLVEDYSSPTISTPGLCVGIILSEGKKAGFEMQPGENPSFTNVTLKAKGPSSYYERDLRYYTHVLYISQDDSILALVSCVPILDIYYYQWTGIFSKDPTPSKSALSKAHQGLTMARNSQVDYLTERDNSKCVPL